MTNRLANLDINISDIVFAQEFLALASCDNAFIARERFRHHTDPEDDGGGSRRLSGVRDADNIDARPHHTHRVQKGGKPGTQVVFPDITERVVADGAELLELPVCLRPSRRLPRGGTSASD